MKLKDYTNVLIVGSGRVGSTLNILLNQSKKYTVAIEDPFKGIFAPDTFIPDIIHISIPLYDRESFTSDIQRIVERFIKRFEKTQLHFYDKRRVIIMDSTIVLGILPALQNHYDQYCDFVYSPIRATDSSMEEELLKYERYFAPVETMYKSDEQLNETSTFIEEYYKSLNLTPKRFKSSEALVLGKLVAVGWYTLNIAYTQQIAQICNQHGIDFNEAYTEFTKNETVGHQYDPESKSADYLMERPIFFPGIIEGHCCIPDTIIMLREQYGDSSLWRWIIQTNEKQRMLLNDRTKIIENNPAVEPGTNLPPLID